MNELYLYSQYQNDMSKHLEESEIDGYKQYISRTIANKLAEMIENEITDDEGNLVENHSIYRITSGDLPASMFSKRLQVLCVNPDTYRDLVKENIKMRKMLNLHPKEALFYD